MHLLRKVTTTEVRVETEEAGKYRLQVVHAHVDGGMNDGVAPRLGAVQVLQLNIREIQLRDSRSRATPTSKLTVCFGLSIFA